MALSDTPPDQAPADDAHRIGEPLTAQEGKLLDFLIEHLRTHCYQPSIREMGVKLKIRSTKTVSELIAALQAKGYVEIPGGETRPARALRIVGLEINVTRRLVPPRGRAA